MAGNRIAVINGKRFEEINDLAVNFSESPFFKAKKTNKNYYGKIVKADIYCITLFNGKNIGYVFNQHCLYKFFGLDEKENGSFKWKKHISKKLLPDDCFFDIDSNSLFVIEKKYQDGYGSVDEKLQSFDFKRKEYYKLLKEYVPNINIKFWYILYKEYFIKPEFEDVREYIIDNESFYFYSSNSIDSNIAFYALIKKMGVFFGPVKYHKRKNNNMKLRKKHLT